MTGVGVAAAVGALTVMVGFDLALFQSDYDTLTTAYAGHRIVLKWISSSSGEEFCGVYAEPLESRYWKFLSDRDGVWAQGLTKAWREPGGNPQAAAELDRRWTACKESWKHRKGHMFDVATDPMVVAVLNWKSSHPPG